MRVLSFLIFFISSLVAFEYSATSTSIDNGRTTLFEFPKERSIKYETLTLGKRSYRVYPNPLDSKKMYALLPVGYYTKPHTDKVELSYKENGENKTKNIVVAIKDGNYKKERIKVQKSKVNPKGKKVNERINKEYHEAMDLYATSTPKSHLQTPFILPMGSFITSDFGKGRVYNDELKGYHSGTDFRAAMGTPILASNDGEVVLVKERFYSGGTVIIDHGQGIYTCYYHMSEFSVEKGQMVKKGEVVGLSGATGRVTGPHLHFSVRVGGVQVDPLQFVNLMNENILNKQG